MIDLIIPAKQKSYNSLAATNKMFKTKDMDFGENVPTTQSIPYHLLESPDVQGLSTWYNNTQGLVEISINSVFHKWPWIFDRKAYGNRPKFTRLTFRFPLDVFMECLDKTDLVYALAISEWGEAKAHEWLDKAYQPSCEQLMDIIKEDLKINEKKWDGNIKNLLVGIYSYLWDKRDVKTIFFFDEIYFRNPQDVIANIIFREVTKTGGKAYYSALAELLKGDDFRDIYFNMRIRPLVENVMYGSIRDLCHRYLAYLPNEAIQKKDKLSFFFLSQSKNHLDRDVAHLRPATDENLGDREFESDSVAAGG